MAGKSEKQKSLLGRSEHVQHGCISPNILRVVLATISLSVGLLLLLASVSLGTDSKVPWTILHAIDLRGLSSRGHAGKPTYSALAKASKRAPNSLRAAALHPPLADLTPAVEKYARLPPPADLNLALDKYADLPLALLDDVDSVTTPRMVITAKGTAPEGPDPFKLVEQELQPLSNYVNDLVLNENPVLTLAAGHFFNEAQGKRFRPTIVVLMGRALNPEHQSDDVKRRQLMLAQITEMIHVASLIHDDVLDDAETRRGGQAVHTKYSNKVAVLGGDYLLARASLLLARLQHVQVVQVMASALDSLVQGELLQANSNKEQRLDMEYYLRKSYFKTSSLISNACKSSAMLAGYSENDDATVAAEQFGYHLGMAYQIVDDILDFTGASAQLGKPAQADMQLGLATAPILFAAQADRNIVPLIKRQFKQAGDIQKVIKLAAGTNCVSKSYELAEFHAQSGMEALLRLEKSDSRDALLKLLHKVLSRQS